VELLLNFISWNEILVCWAIVIIASVLQISAGMGFGMLASPLIALVKPELVPGSVLVMGLLVAVFGAWRERENIVYSEISAGVSGRIVGSSVAMIILLFLPNVNAFLILFGTVMLIAITLTAFGKKITFTIKNLFGLSILSGVMGSLTAVGAPPMVLIYHDKAPEIVRPTLNAFFFSGCVLGLISLSLSGWFKWSDFLVAFALVPALLFGIYIGQFFKSFSSRSLSRILLFLSAIASTILIFRGIGVLG